MKLVVFGLSVSSAWGNGHATLWRGVLRSLARAGHEVAFFERDTPFYASHRDMPRGDGYEIIVYPTWAEVLPRARAALEGADVAIVTSYQADAIDATELVLSSGALRVFYDLDTPVTFELLDQGKPVPWLPSTSPTALAPFDLVLSFTGGATLEVLKRRLGARRVAPLYGCVAPRREWACDLSYLGTYAADRQESVERLFLDVARRLSASSFLLGGPMYPATMERPSNVTLVPHVAPADHPAFYCSSRCTLNLTRAPMKRAGFCPSARLFEAAACGVPIVSDAWEGLDRFFEPDREIIVAGSTADVLRVLALEPSALASIARRARERTLDEHTSERRADELVRVVESTPHRGASAA